jgi:protein-tyrosine phosphatase
MTHPFDRLPLDQTSNAGLIFTPCPGTKGTSVAEALATLQQAGAAAVISLNPMTELESLHVADLGAQVNSNGLQWFHCPIEDNHAPLDDFAAAWQQTGTLVHQLLNEGKTVAIHCKGGSGRTGLMAAQILLERGNNKEIVKSIVQALRPYALTLEPHVHYFNSLQEGQ